MMPTIFIGDGAPEARDYDSNYLFYDEDDIESMEAALEAIQQSKKIDACLALAAQTTIERVLEKKKRSRKVEGRCQRALAALKSGGLAFPGRLARRFTDDASPRAEVGWGSSLGWHSCGK